VQCYAADRDSHTDAAKEKEQGGAYSVAYPHRKNASTRAPLLQLRLNLSQKAGMRESLCWSSRGWTVAVLTALLAAWCPRTAHGYSLLPLAVEESDTLPHGVVEAGLGTSYFHNMRFPAFTPPGTVNRQDLVAVPQLLFHIGVGGWVEIQAAYETLYLDEEWSTGETNQHFNSGDLRLFTKVRVMRESDRLPGLAVRFGVKLPNANKSLRLGTDDTDFGADVIASKDFGPVSAHVNLGILLLGNSGSTMPAFPNWYKPGGQDDTVHYDVGLVSAPLGKAETGAGSVRLMGEFVGIGSSHYNNDQSAMRLGLQAQHGPVKLYVGASVGLVTASEDVGATAGFVYTFEPAKLLARE